MGGRWTARNPANEVRTKGRSAAMPGKLARTPRTMNVTSLPPKSSPINSPTRGTLPETQRAETTIGSGFSRLPGGVLLCASVSGPVGRSRSAAVPATTVAYCSGSIASTVTSPRRTTAGAICTTG